MQHIKEFNSFKYVTEKFKSPGAAAFAVKSFKAKLRNKTGKLYHTSNAIAIMRMLRDNEIKTANVIADEQKQKPWWRDAEYGELKPHYGDFVYTHRTMDDDFYGISDPDVSIEIDVSKIKHDIFEAPLSMEDGVTLINGNVPISAWNKIIINLESIYQEDRDEIVKLAKKKKLQVEYIGKHNDNI